jgi:Spy/CpxP family protein refolding chaperone
MKNNPLKYILILSLLLNFSLLGAAWYTHYRQSHARPAAPLSCDQRSNYLFQELSLKPEQIELFRQKAAAFHGALNKKRQEVDRLRGVLFGLLRGEHPDDKTIEATITRINTHQHEMQQMVVAHILEFKALLEKDQQMKFLGLIEGAMAKRQESFCP